MKNLKPLDQIDKQELLDTSINLVKVIYALSTAIEAIGLHIEDEDNKASAVLDKFKDLVMEKNDDERDCY